MFEVGIGAFAEEQITEPTAGQPHGAIARLFDRQNIRR